MTTTTDMGLRVGHLNICSLPNKISELKVLFHKFSPHILGISETKIKFEKTEQETKITHETLCVSGYSLFRRDQRDYSKSLHTGMAVYVHNSIIKQIKRRADLETGPIECMWLEFKKDHVQSELIGNIYRNPKSEPSVWMDDFITLMDTIDTNHKNVTMLGDFNLDLQKIPEPSWYLKWKTTMTLFNLKQLVNEYTRITPTSATLIDHVYTNNVNMVTNVEVKPFGRSDHKSIFCSLSYKVPKPKKNEHTSITYRCLKKFVVHDFFSDLNTAPFHSIYNESNADIAFDLFLALFYSIINKHAPLRQKRVKHQTLPSWMTQDLIEAMEVRNSLEQILGKGHPDYKKQRNKVSQLNEKAKNNRYTSTIEKDNSITNLWRAMNEVLDKGKQSTRKGNTKITPEEFNDHFLKLASTLASQIEPQNDDHFCDMLDNVKRLCDSRLENDASFSVPFITVHEVGTYIEGLDKKKAMGPEQIPVHLIKLALPYIVEPLTYLYNLCIGQNTFPSSLKIAKVIPLPKSKDLSDPNNFRPISLLPILTKPLEKHVQKHLLSYMESNQLFHKFQSGFRKDHSCHTSLTALIDTWLSAVNDEEITGAVFLDFKKAFDLVNHSVLLEKLHMYLKDKDSIAFFASYLKDRKQFVSVNSCSSSIGLLTHGVPQGSILGPVLFCIYINDLPLCLEKENTRCDLFADDSSIHAKAKTIDRVEVVLQNSLNKIDVWCNANRMILNSSKTKSMVITTRQKHQLETLSLKLSINSSNIEQVKEHRVLGIVLDQEMKWEAHIRSLCKKLARNLYLLSKLSKYASKDALLMFYYAHVLSHINYASSIWDGAAEVHLKKVDSLHRRAAKIIGRGLHISTEDKQKHLNMLPLRKQLSYNKAVAMFKVFHGNAPSYLLSSFKKASSDRFKNFIPPLPRINLVQNSFSFSGSKTWNALSSKIKNCRSLKSFKNNLMESLLN